MQISKFTDYTFRVLLYMASHREELCTVERLASTLEVSEHHLKKVIHKLAKTEYVVSMKGRSGGVRLAVGPEEINLGKVLEMTEENLCILGCIKTGETCSFLNKECKLKRILENALEQFMQEVGKCTLADLL